MPRKRRMLSVGQPCHAVNRGQDGRPLFLENAHYQHFIDLMAEGKRRYPVRIYSYTLIGNHFHKLLSAVEEGAISAYMQWVEGRYGYDLRYDAQDLGQGHVFQRRFWAEPIGWGPFHFINVQRYIEANPVKAGLVRRAEDWKWGSVWERETKGRSLLDPSPLILPDDWLSQLNSCVPPEEGSDPYPFDNECDSGSDPSSLRKPASRKRRDKRRALPPTTG
jgi:putative transposase